MKRLSWQLTGLAAVFLCATAVSVAAIQGETTVCQLSMGDWQLCEKDGRVCLAKGKRGSSSKWSVSAPTIKDADGKFLAADPAGRSPTVHLVKQAGPHTRWTFEITSHIIPRDVPVGGRQFMQQGD